MKKTRKRMLGLLGLGLVVATTIFAASLPGPEAAAVSTSSVTDTIILHVDGVGPFLDVTSDQDNKSLTSQNTIFSFCYVNAEYIDATAFYTNDQGVTTEIALIEGSDRFVNYKNGTYTKPLDLLSSGFGYGEYTIESVATGFDGVTYPETINFTFIPLRGEASKDPDDGLTYLDLEYDTKNREIDHIKINIYDEDDNLVDVISPITVKTPGTRVELPFSENNLPTGDYTIEITAYNAAGDLLYDRPYYTSIYYEAAPVPTPTPAPVPTPNTGFVFAGINISKTDFLITSLIAFSLVSVSGFIFVAKGRRQ